MSLEKLFLELRHIDVWCTLDARFQILNANIQDKEQSSHIKLGLTAASKEVRILCLPITSGLLTVEPVSL